MIGWHEGYIMTRGGTDGKQDSMGTKDEVVSTPCSCERSGRKGKRLRRKLFRSREHSLQWCI